MSAVRIIKMLDQDRVKKSIDETAETQLDELVDELIEEENYLCYDVASNHGQMFDNVKHTKWFREALKEHIQETEKKNE